MTDRENDFETIIRNKYQKIWSNKKNIQNLALGWHFGYYEKGFRSYKKAIINMNNYVSRLLEIDDNNLEILDAGCGVGATTTHLAKKHPNSNFYGITLSSNEVMLAEELKKKNNLKNINFYQKSYNLTDFANEYFDCIYALESVCYAKDITIFLREMNRILKKNGKLVIIDIFSQYDISKKFCRYFKQKNIREKNSENVMLTIDRLKEKLIVEGFRNITIHDLIKSRNVKFFHVYRFGFQEFFRTFRNNTSERIGQKSHKPLFFRWSFLYSILFKYLQSMVARYSYFSIIANKK